MTKKALSPRQNYGAHEMSELEIILAEVSARQRKLRHHHKRQTKVWHASAVDMGTQMTMECNPSIGRKYLTQREAVELWERRTDRLESRRTMIRVGAGVRQPHKAKNKFSKEEMGTLSKTISVCRFDGSYITKVCYRKNLW